MRVLTGSWVSFPVSLMFTSILRSYYRLRHPRLRSPMLRAACSAVFSVTKNTQLPASPAPSLPLAFSWRTHEAPRKNKHHSEAVYDNICRCVAIYPLWFCLKCHNKYHRLWGLNSWNLFSHSSGRKKSRIKVLASSMSSEGLVCESQMTVSVFSPHIVFF